MKNALLVLTLLTSFAHATDSSLIRSQCVNRIEGEIDLLDEKISKDELLADILVGASLGGLAGASYSLDIRNTYQVGFGAGYTGNSDPDYQSGYMAGQTGIIDPERQDGYFQGYYDDTYSKSEVTFENGVRNTLIGAGIGAIGGVGYNLINQSVKKNTRKNLKQLLNAYAAVDMTNWESISDDEDIQAVYKKVFKKKERTGIDKLRVLLLNFGEDFCTNVDQEVNISKVRKYRNYYNSTTN